MMNAPAANAPKNAKINSSSVLQREDDSGTQ